MRLFLMLLLTSVVQAQEITFVDSLGGYYGLTACDTATNLPKIKVLSKMSLPETRMTILHELVHYRQFSQYPGGCKAMQERYNTDIPFRVAVEAEAYCTAIDFEPNMDRREFMLDDLSMQLFKGTGREKVPYAQVKKIVHDLCNQMRGGTNKPPLPP